MVQISTGKLETERLKLLPCILSNLTAGRSKYEILFVLESNLNIVYKKNSNHVSGYKSVYQTDKNILALKLLSKNKFLVTLEVPIQLDQRGISLFILIIKTIYFHPTMRLKFNANMQIFIYLVDFLFSGNSENQINLCWP